MLGRFVGLLAAAAIGLLVIAAGASADVPSVDIGASGGPLTHVAVGNDLSCQVQHTGDSALEFYPSSSTPGSCGTFIWDGTTLYTPDFDNHSGSATGSLGTRTP